MILRVDPSGRIEALYAEAIDLAALGELTIRRAGHVEPDPRGAGSPTSPRWAAPRWGRSRVAPRPWPRSRPGSTNTASARRNEYPRPESHHPPLQERSPP